MCTCIGMTELPNPSQPMHTLFLRCVVFFLFHVSIQSNHSVQEVQPNYDGYGAHFPAANPPEAFPGVQPHPALPAADMPRAANGLRNLAGWFLNNPGTLVNSDFPARLGLKAGSTARLLEASGLCILRPEPFIEASKVLGSSQPASRVFICHRPRRLTSHGSYVRTILFNNDLVTTTHKTTI